MVITNLYSGAYNCFSYDFITLKSYVGLLIFLGCTISAAVSGCRFLSLFSADLLDLYDNVPLLNYLLTGLLVVIFNCL